MPPAFLCVFLYKQKHCIPAYFVLRWVFCFRLSVREYPSVLLLVHVFASSFGAGVWRLGAVKGWQQVVPAWNNYICPQCVCVPHGYLCSQWIWTHKTVYIVCIHVRFVYVPSVWCMHMHPQIRAEGAKNPLALLNLMSTKVVKGLTTHHPGPSWHVAEAENQPSSHLCRRRSPQILQLVSTVESRCLLAFSRL